MDTRIDRLRGAQWVTETHKKSQQVVRLPDGPDVLRQSRWGIECQVRVGGLITKAQESQGTLYPKEDMTFEENPGASSECS